jgi:hypothetical protein
MLAGLAIQMRSYPQRQVVLGELIPEPLDLSAQGFVWQSAKSGTRVVFRSPAQSGSSRFATAPNREPPWPRNGTATEEEGTSVLQRVRMCHTHRRSIGAGAPAAEQTGET